jgi:hypothetical protein
MNYYYLYKEIAEKKDKYFMKTVYTILKNFDFGFFL